LDATSGQTEPIVAPPTSSFSTSIFQNNLEERPPKERRTEVVHGVENAARVALQVFQNAKSFFHAIGDWKATSLATEVELYKDAYLDMKRRGVKVYAITEIRKENLEQCKQLLNLGIVTELRHLENARGNFAVTEKEYLATPVIKETGPTAEVIYSNDDEIVEQNRYVFDVLWEKAIPGDLRIQELENKLDLGYVQLTYEVNEILRRFRDFVEETRHDALIILPGVASFDTNPEQFRTLARKARENGVRVKVLIAASLSEWKNPSLDDAIEKYGLDGIQFRFAERISSNFAFGIYDMERMIAVHNIEPLPSLSSQPVEQGQGMHYVATITTNRETVEGMASIFDSLWHESELREREERSRKRAELLQDILTHDIRNYNQVIRLSAELLKDELQDRKRIHPITDSLIRAVDESTRLVSRARDFGKMLSEVSPRLYPVSVSDLLKNALDLVKSTNPDKVIIETNRLPPRTPRAVADEFLLQAFVNLYSNSVRYSDGRDVVIDTSVEEEVHVADDGETAQSAACSPGYWKISISDHGRGIPDELKEVMFKRYLQNAKGSGLGMSIVHALVVERYHGRVRIRDRVAGDHSSGTVVEIWLPKA